MKSGQMKTILLITIITLTFTFGAVVPAAFTQTLEKQEADVAMTWEDADVFVPGSFFKTSPGKVSVNKPLPVVIYLHGCTGIDYNHDTLWGDFIKRLGFIAVLPNSMARPWRRLNCEPKSHIFGFFPQANEMRMEEIRYALEQVKKSPWADTKNIFLMGHSEGGRAVARNTLHDFRGIIISGWSCTDSAQPNFNGIFAPMETPILTLEWDHDPWRDGTSQQGSCANKFGKRKKARQVLFSGTQHSTYGKQEAQDAVAQFLRESLAP